MDAKAELNSIVNTSIEPWASYITFEVERRETTVYQLTQSVESCNQDLGVLDLVTASYLHSVHELEGVSFRAVISSGHLNNIPRKKTRKAVKLDITINILGPEDIAEDVGEELGKVGGYLQHPVFLEAGIKYANPHYFYAHDNMTDLRSLIGPVLSDTKQNRVSHVVEKIMDSIETVQTSQSRQDASRYQCMSSIFLKNTELKR